MADETEPSKTKRVFLVRHAESLENVRSHALITSVNDLMSFRLPSLANLGTGLSLGQRLSIDSDVSEKGVEQIQHVGELVREGAFLSSENVQVVLHSPLLRARRTCHGIFGVVDNTLRAIEGDEDTADGDLIDAANAMQSTSCSLWGSVPVCEVELIREKTPSEYVNVSSLDRRIAGFEKYIMDEREEDVIVVVGHSQYFRRMLGLDYKFQNCDVWETTLTKTASNKLEWTLGQRVYSTPLANPLNFKYLSTV